MFRNLLAKLARSREPMFTSEQLLETFQAGFRAGQAAGPAEPVIHRPLVDIVAEHFAERSPFEVRS